MSELMYKGVKISELKNPKRMSRQQTNFVLACILTEKGIKKWWTTHMDKLDGQTPDQVWKQDKKKVYEIAYSYLDTSFS